MRATCRQQSRRIWLWDGEVLRIPGRGIGLGRGTLSFPSLFSKRLQVALEPLVRTEINISPLNQEIQHGQPRSSTPDAVASGISSFLLIHEPLHHNINQQIQHGQPSSTSAASDSGKLENYV